MRRYFAYIRVSTAKQGERGSSLQEQRDAIQRFATRNGLAIAAWFEERETAAKQGRRMFSRMLDELARGSADGVIIHKIDRGARNLRDWANIGDLIDRGIDVQFVHDNLDLRSRGGRLSADIQAVVAADYIRNLRDEVKKGFYGRLKQGLYPLPAPVGYLDRGKGQQKQPDPIMAPLVKRAFALYAENRMSLADLQAELEHCGLRSRSGNALGANRLSAMLHNPFYAGLIYIRRTNETFSGIHTPLISMALFKRVQAVLAGKSNGKAVTHDFTFRRFVRCGGCGWHLVGERKKGRYVYYRCYRPGCVGTVIRERDIHALFEERLDLIRLSDEEVRDVGDLARDELKDTLTDIDAQKRALQMRLTKCEERLFRLSDALIDGLIEKDAFTERRQAALQERQSLLDVLSKPNAIQAAAEKVFRYLELRYLKELGYEEALPHEQRDIAQAITWNFVVRGRTPEITLKSPYQEIAEFRKLSVGGPYRGTPGTQCKQLLDILKQVAKLEGNGVADLTERDRGYDQGVSVERP